MKVVVVGWHGADWKAIHPLVDAGLMPNLHSLIERGVVGLVKAIGPAVPAILWTSIATGKPADEHGILSSFEREPLSGRLFPITGRSRRVKTVWNIAMQSGLTAHVASWRPNYPAEALNGSSVTHEFTIPLTRPGEPWPVLPRVLYPERLRSTLAELRMHGGELTGDDLLPFIPALAEIDQEMDDRVIKVADILGRAGSTHAVTTWLMQHEPWNLMMVSWEGVERACYEFLRYTAPRMPHVSDEDRHRYGQVVDGMYRFHDMMLGRLVELAGPDATFVVVSPSGFRIGAERPESPHWRDLPGAWLRPYGMMCIAGPGIRRDELLHGVTLFDIAPTILALLGLPAAADMPGKVIDQAFLDPPSLKRIPSWEDVPGDCGMWTPETEESREAGAAAVAELAKLGYSDPDDLPGTAAIVRCERLYNLGLVHLGAGRFVEARYAFAELAGDMSQDHRILLWLAQCHLLCADRDACRETLRRTEWSGPAGAMASLMEAQVQSDLSESLAAVRRAESLGQGIPFVDFTAGCLYLRMKRWKDAEAALRRAVASDPSFQLAHDVLSRLLALRGKNDEAVAVALDSLAIDYGSAPSHLALGLAMLGSGDESRALQAFEESAALNPELRVPGVRAAAKAKASQ